ncbi:MAG: outer membrane beta-barrel protein [Gemmatimonadetes bacterium]|nr:outer membrane beta-barrel protein [Gemmatimonadota bacterium]
MDIEPVDAQGTAISNRDHVRQTETAAEATESATHLTNFYLRVGASLDLSSKTRFGDRNCLSTSPAALFGCGTGGDGIARGTRGDFGMAGGVEVGLGYLATPGLRLETSLSYRPRFTFKGTANFLQTDALQSVSADLRSASGMIAAHLDLTTYGPFRVFAGTGAGLHYIDISEFHMTFPRTQTIVPDGQQVDFTVMLAAGVATSLSDRITLDLAWRYVDWGIVETGSATGEVIWKDGSREPLELDLAETWAMLRGRGLRVSLRYGF